MKKEKIDYRVEFEDWFYEVPRKNVLFRDYDDAEAYYNEKVEDNTGRYRKVRLIEHKVVETETEIAWG